MPWAPAITAVLMPMTSPREETSGPPELPGLSAASVWITSSISRPRATSAASGRAPTRRPPSPSIRSPADCRSRPRAGRAAAPWSCRAAPPAATTSSTTRSKARSVCGSSPSTRALTVRVSASASRTRRGALHDVAVGQHQAVGRDHHARAGAAALALLAVGRRLDPHDGRADAVDDVDHRLRVGVEQGPIVVGGFCGDTCVLRRAQLVGDEGRMEVEHAPIWGLRPKTARSTRAAPSR